LLVDFWETTCGACVEELPYLMDFYRSFQPRGFALVGLSVDPSPQIVKDYLATRPVPYVMGMKSVTADFSLSGSIGMPTKVLVDQDSRIVARYIGGVSPVNQTCLFYEREISGLLRSPPPGPRVNVARAAGNIRLSWSATEPPQRLESSVNSASSWNAINAALTTNNGQIFVTLPTTNAFQFFRLRRL
jgi:thiol-disulfide isomerase/thioredoxin